MVGLLKLCDSRKIRICSSIQHNDVPSHMIHLTAAIFNAGNVIALQHCYNGGVVLFLFVFVFLFLFVFLFFVFIFSLQ